MNTLMKTPITILIPTYNEEKNIERAVASVAPFVDQIIIIDSWSSDNTIQVAKAAADNVDVISVEFTTFSNKMNIGLASDSIRNEWVMRLDADEIVVDPEFFFNTLRVALDARMNDMAGYYLFRRYYFMGKWIRYGGMYPRMVLRVFNRTKAKFEDKSTDEKMIIDGSTDILNIDIADDCQKGIKHWARKHIQYAKREASDYKQLYTHNNCYDLEFDNITLANKKKYYRMPVFVRPILYFAYRYFVLKGIIDGPKGWLYHFSHAFAYREFVDFFIVKLTVVALLRKSLKRFN